jgi:uncharacterized membrane protein
MSDGALIQNDAVVVGLLAATLGLVFWTTESTHPFFRRFYRYVPALVLCYIVPALYNTFGLVDGAASQVYPVVSRYVLPATLALLTLATDVPGILRLGPKLLILFLVGTAGVIIGGPVALGLWQVLTPDAVDGDVWRGLAGVAGSWIGGSANQAAMKDVFEIDANLFGTMVAVDVIVSSLWLALLLWIAANQQRIDARHRADTAVLETLRQHVAELETEQPRAPRLPDLVYVFAIAFGVMGLSHALARPLAAAFEGVAWAERASLASQFFWIVVLATTAGLALSFTRARRLELVGASRVGTLLLYVLIASIGMQMNLRAIATEPALFGLGLTWIAIHGALIYAVARWLRAPMFYLAVGSEANIGGAASAPIVAAAFHPALAPVGVLFAVLGYALGTYGGWLTGLLMRMVAGQ